MRVRHAFVGCLIVVAALAGALPALAKMPPWTCELSTTRPIVGEPVTIEMQYWWDAEHTDPAESAIFGRYSLTARAMDGAPGDDSQVIPISLSRVNHSTYRGEVVFPDTRRFRIARCGGGYNRWGYPRERGVVIVPREAAGGETGTMPMLVAGAVLTAAAVGSFRVVRTRT